MVLEGAFQGGILALHVESNICAGCVVVYADELTDKDWFLDFNFVLGLANLAVNF